MLFPNLLPQAQNFPLHLGVRQDQFHSIVRHQFLFPKEDNMPFNLSSFFTTSILPSFFSFNFYISYFIISSNLSKNLDRKRSAIFSRLRPAFLPPGRPVGAPLRGAPTTLESIDLSPSIGRHWLWDGDTMKIGFSCLLGSPTLTQ